MSAGEGRGRYGEGRGRQEQVGGGMEGRGILYSHQCIYFPSFSLHLILTNPTPILTPTATASINYSINCSIKHSTDHSVPELHMYSAAKGGGEPAKGKGG